MATNTRNKRSNDKSLPNLIAPQGDTTNLVRNEEDGGNLKKKPGEIATADNNDANPTVRGTTGTQNKGIVLPLIAVMVGLVAVLVCIYPSKEITGYDIKLEKIVEDLSTDPEFLQKLGVSLETQVVSHANDLRSSVTALSENVDTLKEQLENAENKNHDMELSLNKLTNLTQTQMLSTAQFQIDQKKREYLNKSLNQVKNEVKKNISEVKHYCDQQTASATELLREEIKTFRIAKEQFDKDIENLKLKKQEFEGVLDGFKSSLSTINKSKNALNDDVNNQKTKMHNIYLNTFNKEFAIFAIILLYILFMMLAVAMYRLTNRSNDNPNRTSTNGDALIDNVAGKPSRDLANVICVISYDRNAQIHHRQLVSAITDGLKDGSIETFRVVYYLIDRHEDIKNIPPAKLYLMCVNFTERNVIIEQKGLGLGDIKRSTYEKVCSLRGGLVIIYVSDPHSRKLSPHKRYNTDLDCAKSQQELKVLNDVGRFFSVYQMFTDFQLQCLRNLISEIFEKIY